ncbi:uncharacterized protein L199_004354 [Kwoniella botswanensis]|uniref:uncharacterized protein n=1 Tax=Kwoniella botswanensis TaxID=1268659 RepID=UPI00315D78A7
MPNPSKDGGTSTGIGIGSLGWKRSNSPLQIPNTLLEDQDQDQDQGGQRQSHLHLAREPSTTTFRPVLLLSSQPYTVSPCPSLTCSPSSPLPSSLDP